MRYLPKSPAERWQMLAAIGAESPGDLIRSIPEEYRLREPLSLPGPLSEAEIIRYFQERASETAQGFSSFVGAGAYRHFRSVVTDALTQRGEFFTSYTPYQAEISQGTLAAIFEFQTLMCQLTGQEVANASMYDGSTALAESVLMAARISRRRRVVLASSVHPEYRHVLRTYAKNLGLKVEEIGCTETGQMDFSALKGRNLADAAAIVVQSPNFYGVIEDIPELAETAHASGALLVVGIAEAASLGIVRPPSDADIVAMEIQSFGLPLSYGGPYAGVIATREKFVRQMPGRLAGQTTDAEGHRGFVLTLATREQHIRREKATSNICTNEALCALSATIHLCLLGKEGLRELALQNLAKARYAQSELGKIPGVRRVWGGPAFNEFACDFPRQVRAINKKLLGEKIIGPFPLDTYFPELSQRGLVCVTEAMTRAEIDRFAAALRRILESGE